MGQVNTKAELQDIFLTLSETDVSPEAHDFWDELWKLATTPEDIFELVGPADVRDLIAKLCQIVHTPVPIYFGQALNCVRVLTRLMPFLLEQMDGDFAQRLCWSSEAAAEGEESSEPLGRLLVHATLHLLFLPVFTVGAEAFEEDEDAAVADSAPASALWCGGLGSFEANPGQAVAFDKNRVEVLRLLLTCCCEPLFSPAEKLDPLGSMFFATVCARDAPNARLLLYSLLNTIFTYDPTGFGVPYGSALASSAPTDLFNAASQVAIALLDFGAITEDNVYRTYIAELRGAAVFDFVFDGFDRLLNNVHEALNTTLPGSLVAIECHQEILVLLWKFLEANDGFTAHVLAKRDVTRLVVPVCFLEYEARKDPAKKGLISQQRQTHEVGLVHICTFVLIKLSGERAFCLSLNKPFREKLPVSDSLPLSLSDASHADLVIITLHKLVVAGGDKVAPLYNCFLTIIANISPYVKSLSLVAAVKLVNLFELFAAPKFLLANETNYIYVALLLEIFNNVVQYQYHGNPHLVYAILRRKQVFDDLKAFKVLDKALPAKKAADAGPPPPPTTAPQEEEGGATEDKKNALPPTILVPPAPLEQPTAALTKEGSANWTPSQAWVDKVKADMPMATMGRLLQHLAPLVDDLVTTSAFSVDEHAILDFIRETTLVGLLPVPHPIVIRKYQPNTFTSLWFSAFLWGLIFLQNQNLPLFDGGAIKLFTVSIA